MEPEQGHFIEDKRIRDHWLRSFPEQSPNPVVEVNLHGQIEYINPVGRALFPSLEREQIDHPYLTGWQDMIRELQRGADLSIVREVQVGERYYQQSVILLERYHNVRIYGIEITEQKRMLKVLQEAKAKLENQTEELAIQNEELQSQSDEILSQTEELTTAYRTLHQKQDLSKALNHINEIIHSQLGFDEIMQQTITEAAKVIKSDTAAINLRKGDKWVLSYVFGFPPDVLGTEMDDDQERHTVLAIRTKKPVAVQDTYHDGRFNQEHFKAWGIQSVLVVPILIQEEAIGAIYFNYHHSTFSFEERHINFGLQLSSTLSLAIQNSRLIEQLKAELAMVKHTKDSLQANQKKLADILSSINDGFFECDREWRITYLNRIAATILDYQGKRLLGKNLWEAFPSLLGTKHETYYRQVMEKRRYAHFEIQDADGKKCFDVRVHPSKVGITVNWVDISEQKNMDQAIRKQANKLQEQASMLDLAHILVRDMNSKIIYWNRGAEELYGYSKEEAVGKISHKLFKTVFPESMREIEKVLMERGAWEGELIHTRRDGTKVYVASHQVVHLDAQGQPAAIIEVNNDITGQKQFEQSLKESEEKFRALADSNPLIIWMTDSEGGVNFVNRSYRDYFGVSLEQVQGGQWQPLVHPDEAPGYIEKFMRSLKEHTSFAAEVRVRHANGEWRWIESYGEPRLSTKGEFLGYVGNSQDITERKQAEQALRKSEKEARERALELATIMDTVPAIIWIARDPRCQTMVGNRFGQEFLGMPSGANISKSAPSQALSQQPYKTYQGKREIAPEELPMQIAASIGVSTKDYEFDLRFSDGETKTLLGDIAPLLDEKGRPSGAVAAFVDITERKKMEQALEEANSQLEQRVRERTQELEQALANEKLLQQEIIQSEKFAALARLVASVAHEINNPLQTIQNCLFLLQSDAAPGISQDAVQMAITEGRRIGTLVQQLRETYRPSIEARITDFDLIELLNNVHLLVDPKLKENRINWKTENWPERLNINGIRDQMKQVFLNICLNAIDAMESQGGELTVDISIPPDEPKVCIAFKDTGMGIEQELLSQLFEPFITTKEKGTGLGLTICYEIIKNHGGDITVESVVGEGTTFEVWVPKK